MLLELFLQRYFLPLLFGQKRVEVSLHKSAIFQDHVFFGKKPVLSLPKGVLIDGRFDGFGDAFLFFLVQLKVNRAHEISHSILGLLQKQLLLLKVFFNIQRLFQERLLPCVYLLSSVDCFYRMRVDGRLSCTWHASNAQGFDLVLQPGRQIGQTGLQVCSVIVADLTPFRHHNTGVAIAFRNAPIGPFILEADDSKMLLDLHFIYINIYYGAAISPQTSANMLDQWIYSIEDHFFLAAAFLASFLPLPAGALSAASFSLAFFSASNAAFFFFMISSFFFIVSASILMVVWQNPQQYRSQCCAMKVPGPHEGQVLRCCVTFPLPSTEQREYTANLTRLWMCLFFFLVVNTFFFFFFLPPSRSPVTQTLAFSASSAKLD